MCSDLSDRRLQILNHLRLGVTKGKLIGYLVEVCSLANPLERVHTQTKLRRCVDDVLDVARIDQPRQMEDDGGAQPRSKIRRICRQIPHGFVKGKIQPCFNVVIYVRRRFKRFSERKSRRHGLDVQMVILIDEDADACVCTDVCHPIRQRLGKFLADEPLLDQNLAFECAQLINRDPIKRLPELRINICENSVQCLLNLCQLTEIGAPRKRKPHEIACQPHAA